ncbi:4-oxalocrotonate decarboxylase [Microbispora hainanensis]|jgi:2-oxo-3-hexenedioate decarboxylase|uniref:4-oxalocrotonate decarboxylase n=1 Tax=Microbispora hainanensis TaxID=568844 RepID=A0ABZ1SLZ1_9ACTN|nr:MULTISPECIES: fumarylacetoacetate hydrolase family protein [Microbispora]GGO22494.1 4-oxalocrotonate decarboxylase [Microbispora rosea subsp. aerata]GIH57432.1 4-oxalocrotonate decarboxylase [Microbispora rosea subsp. aerata]GLJ86383.1 4-oxalocrotonate decarboxylase [Microbispora rosea subsp. aerata]
MTANTWTVDRAVEELRAAESTRTARHPITEDWPGLDLGTAYQVQSELVAARVAGGERIVGVKLGLTSRAKQRRMGVDAPLTGWLTDGMVLDAGAHVRTERLIHPRVEPEIVFTLGRRLEGPGVTPASAMAAVRSVSAGLEVIDSRYRDFRFTLPDVVADNASSAQFVVGDVEVDPAGLDLALEACVLSVAGTVVDTATGAAVQGHPARALALAANSLAERGLALEEGWIVLTGGMTDAVPLEPGRPVAAEFAHLGALMVTCR